MLETFEVYERDMKWRTPEHADQIHKYTNIQSYSYTIELSHRVNMYYLTYTGQNTHNTPEVPNRKIQNIYIDANRQPLTV